MELWFLSLCSLLCGVIFTPFLKNSYKNIVKNIFLIISLSTIAPPVIKSLNYGNFHAYDFEYFLFSQKLIGIIDPVSAFFVLLIVVFGFLYLVKDCTAPDNSIHNHAETILLTFLLSLFAIGIQNGLLFFILYTLIFTSLIFLININNNKLTKFRLLSLNLAILFSAIAIMLLTNFSDGFEFNKMAESLKLDATYSGNIFMLTLGAFGLPFMLSDFLFETFNRENNYKKINICNSVFYIFCFYGLYRFIGMGATPIYWQRNLVLTITGLLLVFSTVRLYKSTKFNEMLNNLNFMQKTLAILGLIVGTCGYTYEMPLVSILGFSSGMFFLINSIFNSLLLLQDQDSESTQLSDNSFCLGKINLLNCMGIPCTIGFCAWVLIFSALYFGILSENSSFRSISVIILVFLILLISSLLIKLFLTYKSNLVKFTFTFSNKSFYFDYAIPTLIILTGLFPQLLLNIVCVPVSMFVGGTKYFELFTTVKAAAACLSIYTLIFVLTLCAYAVIKFAIKKLLKSN